MARGRPTKEEEKKIKEKILEFYEQGISPSVAARHSGVNPKTVYKYYRIWDEQRIDPDDANIMRRIKETKESSIQSLEIDILSLTQDIGNEKSLMDDALQKRDIKEYDRISKLKLKKMNERTKRIAAKMNLVGALPVDVLVKHRELIA
ncbi:MAG: helix-turn-helix domain-containing protein [Nitrosopumilus sp.]|uniref:helix-turn-helix domain-containing protein n=1 Tax=Nitrosopumilus sp. TaxID=2024843 RepID=UPI0024301391|nr:helix-turn-helix domain-containing protein [Nitrosopumilus sp.]MCV0366353.1 helix-turn-helix domain-containing protein [Nitrosopumilus sp.]